jgi:ABC-2 type transport system permease protein
MFGITFVEQLKRSWRLILYWGGGLSLLVIFVMSILQDVSVVEQYSDILEKMPPQLLNSIGLDEAQAISTPEGFVAFAGLTYGTVVMAILSVVAGLDVTANDEDEGILNVLLSLPVPRWQIIVERALAYALIIVAIALVEFVAMFIGTLFIPVEVNMQPLFLGCINLIPGALSLMAVTIFVASLISNKVIATAISAAFVLTSYVLFVIGGSVNENTFGYYLGRLSVWTYFDSQAVVREGLNPVNIAGLLTLAIVLLFVSTLAFERRDIAG